MSVDPRYHPNIIGKKGAKINKIRETHDVRIQLPERDGSGAAEEITIIGYEHQVKAAEADILKIVHELVSWSNCDLYTSVPLLNGTLMGQRRVSLITHLGEWPTVIGRCPDFGS